MPLDSPLPDIADRVRALNARFQGHGALSVLSHALSDPFVGRSALVSSFGAESVVLLHMVSLIDTSLPVLFIDTELLFEQTMAYQASLAAHLGLTGVKTVRAPRARLFERDPDDMLHHYDPDACCTLRKIEPLANALSGFDAWITGRKRYQGGQRQDIPFFEAESGKRIKVNPLAHWTPERISDHITQNDLPRHPLIPRGYPSIGCAPCTSRVSVGEDVRAGRWRNTEKIECGIHFGPSGATREATAA
ncbi:MAG: phosphoadenylyl-sulfate reductase [Paracoccaceae bacterium]